MIASNQVIRTRASQTCKLCGTQGNILYEGLTDQLFGAPGVWSFRQCPNANCGLVWLDPMPIEADIAFAYRRYYTHKSDRAKSNIVSKTYRSLLNFWEGMTGQSDERNAMQLRYLGDRLPGNLLEIGCGAGDYIATMRTLGWTVEGVDFDPVACQCARDMNALTVHEGTLESAEYEDNRFDAIVMNHVVEHVFDPVALFKESRRILKPNGLVVVVTPNIDSWGHGKFRDCWRGLEPPRHIHIFSPKTIKSAAKLAGFRNAAITTTSANADYIIGASMDLVRGKSSSLPPHDMGRTSIFARICRRVKALAYQYREYRLWKKDANLGEEVVLICQK